MSNFMADLNSNFQTNLCYYSSVMVDCQIIVVNFGPMCFFQKDLSLDSFDYYQIVQLFMYSMSLNLKDFRIMIKFLCCLINCFVNLKMNY